MWSNICLICCSFADLLYHAYKKWIFTIHICKWFLFEVFLAGANYPTNEPGSIYAPKTHLGFPDVYVFDYGKHPSTPPLDGAYNWTSGPNQSSEGYLLSQFKLGSFTDDAQICLWDINAVRLQCRLLFPSLLRWYAWFYCNCLIRAKIDSWRSCRASKAWVLVRFGRGWSVSKPIQSIVAYQSEVGVIIFYSVEVIH